jgi:hypothetical protein
LFCTYEGLTIATVLVGDVALVAPVEKKEFLNFTVASYGKVNPSHGKAKMSHGKVKPS